MMNSRVCTTISFADVKAMNGGNSNDRNSSEYQWRIAKMNCAIKYKEAGQFPVSDEELERIIREQIEVLSKVK